MMARSRRPYMKCAPPSRDRALAAELCAPAAGWGGGLCGRFAAEHAIASRGETADQPVRLDRIVDPGCRPAVSHTGVDRLFRYFATVPVEKRQLSTGLRQSALEVAPLRVGRPYAGPHGSTQVRTRRVDERAVLALRCSTHARPAVKDD